MNIEYTSIDHFVDDKSKLIGKIATYDILIDAMEKSILSGLINDKGDAGGHVMEYEMDDSMMRIRTRFRSVTDLTNAMTGLIRLRQYYVNKANGRITVLRGGRL